MIYFKVKQSIKEVKIIFKINAFLKARLTDYKLSRIKKKYFKKLIENNINYDEVEVINSTTEKINNKLKLKINRKKSNEKKNIIWVGTNKNQDFSGFIQSLKKNVNVICFENHMGTYGIWKWDDQGLIRTGCSEIINKNSSTLLDLVKRVDREEGVDLVFGQMMANYISPDSLRAIGDMNIPIINIAMDDRLPISWESINGYRLGASGLASVCDLTLTTCAETCAWYAVDGNNAIFWPLASDPEIFSNNKDDHRDIDVVFIGNKYGIRGEIIKSIVNNGVEVTCYGDGWANGVASFEKSAELFQRAKIILGIGNVGYNKNIFTLKLRDFDALMSGALYITHRGQDIASLYEENNEIVFYKSAKEAAEKIKFFLNNPEVRKKIAKQGSCKARERDTWNLRIETILTKLGII